jgi:hypothetical protein
MNTNTTRFIRNSIVVLVICCATADAQQSGTNRSSLNYGFVSPNTRDGLTIEDAIRGMQSSEESSLLKTARNLGCVVRRRINSTRALGSWSDGAEHSILLRVDADEPTIRYLMSRLGRDANQKAVIYFHPQSDGRAKIYAVRPSKRFRAFQTLARVLDQAGIAFRTLVPIKHNTMVYVVDTENNLAAKMKTAGKRLRARVTSQSGNASFIGDDSVREKGQTILLQEINNYESRHPGLPPPCAAK